MVWVRSEYAGELAVLSTWVAALLPWNIHYAPLSEGASVLFVRFPLLQVRYVSGLPVRTMQLGLPVPAPLADSSGLVVSVIAFQDHAGLTTAYWAWAAGAALYLVALGVSAAYFSDQERVEAWPVDPVKLLGGLLLAVAAALGLASYLTFTAAAFPGVPLPVGVVLVALLGSVLVGAERVN